MRVAPKWVYHLNNKLSSTISSRLHPQIIWWIAFHFHWGPTDWNDAPDECSYAWHTIRPAYPNANLYPLHIVWSPCSCWIASRWWWWWRELTMLYHNEGMNDGSWLNSELCSMQWRADTERSLSLCQKLSRRRMRNEIHTYVFRVLLSPLLMITHSSSTMDYLFSRSAFVGATRKHPILGLNPRIIIADCPRCCGPCFLSAHLNEFFHFSVLRCLIISLSTRLCPFFVSPTIHSNGWWLQKKR